MESPLSSVHTKYSLKKKNLPFNRPPPPPGQKATGDSFIKTFWALEFRGIILLKLIWVSGPQQTH